MLFLKNSVIVLLIVFSFIIVSLYAKEYNDRTDGVTTEIEKNKWELERYADPDSLSVLYVSWVGEYGSMPKFEYCKAIFTNDKETKLIAPWMELIMYKSNINDMKIQKIKVSRAVMNNIIVGD